MLTAQDLHGVVAMMPAFATADAGNIRATATVDVDNLTAGVKRIVDDGVNAIATTGSFGEFHTLLDDEFATLARATVEAAGKRVPAIIGCTSLNSREAVRKIGVARDAGADGVLVGVPFYFPSTVDNAVRFYREVAELFPDLAFMIYHNPTLQNVTLPVEAFRRIVESPNVVAMKDSHRGTAAFRRLTNLVRGRMSVFVNQDQYFPYALLGAAGCWSIQAWMGPWPLLRLRDAIDAGDYETAGQLVAELSAGYEGASDLRWRENTHKLAIGYAGYAKPGPLRPPFLDVPESEHERARKRAAAWQELCAKYRAPAGSTVGG